MAKQRASLPRFRRIAPPPPTALTPDDLALLKRIERYRFVQTTDLYRLFPQRSPDKLSRRLARLYRAGLLDRPPAQIDYYRGGGSKPLVYGLDAAGARLLAETDTDRRAEDIRARNRRYTRDNLDHTLAVTRFLIDLELACNARPDVALIDGRDIGESGRKLAWPVTLPWHGYEANVQIAPDAMFGLKHRHNDQELKSYFFLEMDRGSMTIVPSETVRESQSFLYRSSILRKLFAYAISHTEREHQSRFGIHAARVLTVTSSSNRAEQMRRTAEQWVLKQAQVPADLFLFGVNASSVHELPAFKNARGSETELFPHPNKIGSSEHQHK